MVVYYICSFFGGMFFVNGIPHLVNGVSGRPFPSPFAKPPGKGESSSVVNVLWATFNFVVAYLLLFQAIFFDLRFLFPSLTFFVGGLIMALFLAKHFGKLYGGSTPKSR